jgi:hypothetical protein
LKISRLHNIHIGRIEPGRFLVGVVEHGAMMA